MELKLLILHIIIFFINKFSWTIEKFLKILKNFNKIIFTFIEFKIWWNLTNKILFLNFLRQIPNLFILFIFLSSKVQYYAITVNVNN